MDHELNLLVEHEKRIKELEEIAVTLTKLVGQLTLNVEKNLNTLNNLINLIEKLGGKI